MAKSLVIVESPAKARAIANYLGPGYSVVASYGHVRDLPRSGINVDRENGYEPTYEILKGKERTIAELKREAKKAETIFLAADPDREGEAICWHLEEILRPSVPAAAFLRAEFHEITRTAVRKAIETAMRREGPRRGEIDRNRVDAQQARRIIDRIVGYEVSDLLWSKVWRGLSAGRVQTVALRIIVERESDRERFVAVPYFSVPAILEKKGTRFPARVVSWRGEKLRFDGTDPRLATLAAAAEVLAHVEASTFAVASVEAKERRQNPPPPFTTSKLQQAAARTLGFTVRRTMQVAQRLYEGKALGEKGTVGLITYMRTDSTRSAEEALVAVRDHILATYGPGALPGEPRRFRQKKDVQDAHEAVRPTSMDLPPEAVARFLQAEELKLYRLVWQRFVCSQMTPAVSDVTSVEVEARRDRSSDIAVLRATGSVLKDAGYLAVYGQRADEERAEEREEGLSDPAEGDEEKVRLPLLVEGDVPGLVEAGTEGHETQPPPRFNEASLVKFLEENGIGRPSTYAEILRKIEDREYARKTDRRFLPTQLGRLVVDLMLDGFDEFFKTEYTALMEEKLDEVEEGRVDWRKALAEFDGQFSRDRAKAEKRMASVKVGLPLPEVRERFTHFRLQAGLPNVCERSGDPLLLRMGKNGLFVACKGYPACTFTVDIPDAEDDPLDVSELEGQTCEECGSPMTLRQGRDGTQFLGCSAYPKCRNTVAVKVAGGKAEARPDVPTGEKCPACGHDLVGRHGRFGDYVACSNYPACRFRPPKPVISTGVTCPECGTGSILERKGRFGPFWGCSNYPACKRNLKARPVPKACPSCAAPYLLVRPRKAGAFYACEREGCVFDAPAADLDAFRMEARVSDADVAAAIVAAKPPEKKSRRRKKAAASSSS